MSSQEKIEEGVERVQRMHRLLRECGEDMSCDCGCADKDPEKKADAKLRKKPGEKTKRRTLEGLEDFLSLLSSLLLERRRRKKIGLRTFKNVSQVMKIRSGRAKKVMKSHKLPSAVRKGAAYNRQRR